MSENYPEAIQKKIGSIQEGRYLELPVFDGPQVDSIGVLSFL